MKPLWQEILLPSGDEDRVSELFHENSKIGRYSHALTEAEIRSRMQELHESLPFEGYPVLELPPPTSKFNLSLAQALSTRASCRNLVPSDLTFENVATLLHYAYGVTRDNAVTELPRPFRMVPSGGALYPLELFFYTAHTLGIQSGLYHYNPSQNQIRRLRIGDETQKIAERTVYPDLVTKASLVIFVTAVFERSTFKYGDRGYRFILLEAGHVAQNINLVANGLAMGCVNIGGFFDREIDDFLDLDGVTHSTVYMVAVGHKIEVADVIDKELTHG